MEHFVRKGIGMEEIHDDTIEIPDDIKLYRIVKIWG